jgi:hypothetical protein
MALSKKGKYWYGDSSEDVEAELLKYSTKNVYIATKFVESKCGCGSNTFYLETDEDAGVARRTCVECDAVHFMGDSAEYAEEADFEGHSCICDEQRFELVSGVALYEGSNDVRWYYIGCHCVACKLVGVFADWKCEAGDADKFLADV